MDMTCPKSLGPSLHAQPEPWESVVSLGISPQAPSPFVVSVMAITSSC